MTGEVAVVLALLAIVLNVGLWVKEWHDERK